MTRHKTWALTDVANDLWLDSFGVSNIELHLATPHDWSIRKRTLHGGLREGIDLIEVHNGALYFTVLPTRGMGLWRGEYHGNLLGWHAPVAGPVHPAFVQLADRGGLGWLNGFDELLCRCGLAWNGPPGEDAFIDKAGRHRHDRLTLHGRIANLPAHYVEVRIGLDPPFELSIIGHVEEAGLFSPRLHLTSTCTTAPGSNRMVVHDVIENWGGEPAEMQLLYHCNVGPPFLGAGSRVMAPIRELAPISARAAEDIDVFDSWGGPTAGFAEQVYCYDLLADREGHTLAMLYNRPADRGLVLRFNRRELPCFTVWKNTAAFADGYVGGLEPATNYPNFRGFERRQGRVLILPPGGKHSCTWSMDVQDTASGVAAVLAEIVTLQSQAQAVIHRVPQPQFSPAGERPA
jgi:hypothetical protein